MALGLGLGLSRSGFVGGLDAATQALLSQATTDGYTAASGTTLTALDAYIKGLKADGIWSKLDILYVFATNGDSDFATYNILDPTTFQATKVNAPTFTSNQGFTGNGTSSYLDTNYNPSTNGVNYTLNNASFGIYTRNTNTGGFIDCDGATNFSFLVCDNTPRYIMAINAIVSDVEITPLVSGMLWDNRKQVNGHDFYVNGSIQSNEVDPSNGIPNANFHVLKALSNYGSMQVSIAFAGAELSAEASDFFTRTEAYMDAIGSGVV